MTAIKHPNPHHTGVTLAEAVKAWSRYGFADATGWLGISASALRSIVANATWGLTGQPLRRALMGKGARELEMAIAAMIGRRCGPDVLSVCDPALIGSFYVVPAKKVSCTPARIEELRRQAIELAAESGVDVVSVYEKAAARVAVERQPMSHPSWKVAGH